MSVLFIFIDGIGVGSPTNENPFHIHQFPGFEELLDGKKLVSDTPAFNRNTALYRPIDACLGIEGLPQSGTGQATLFSGINASKIIGKHFGPFPHSGNKHLLAEESLFQKTMLLGKKPFFINAFPKIFFERSEKRNRWSCSTLMTRSAGIPLNSTEEVAKGKALTAEILQDYWKSMLQINIPSITFEEASDRAIASLENYDLVLMEYYLTDKAGHSQDPTEAMQSISRIDSFLKALLSKLPGKHTLVICSDHGNVEDLSVKTHTINPVPLIVRGPGALFFDEVSDLTGVTPAILRSMD